MKNLIAILLFALIASSMHAQPKKPSSQVKWSEKLSETVMRIWPDSFLLESDKAAKWRYDQGVILRGMRGLWSASGDGKWYNYIKKSMDFYLQEDGTIRGYRPDEYNIDHINNGKLLLFLFQVTGKDIYKKAADNLRNQLRTHPRTSEGGYWHKKIYPYQMWLDGLYMAQPFYAEYAKLFREDTIFDDVARQFILMEKHARDPKTGLLYHGWDESREQQWANKVTGQSPHFWGRSLGWFGMALVDVLDHFPSNHPKRAELIAILQRLCEAVRKVQDPATGLWYDVPDLPKRAKNYTEASASCMLAYTFAKGVRKGYLSSGYQAYALQAYKGIIYYFIDTDAKGQVNLKGTVAVSGLGGNPYRDGSFDYYMREPVIVNDPKGMGAFIHCAVEMEMIPTLSHSQGRTVLLDRYFNSEKRMDVNGRSVYWHYVWEEKSHPGFSALGNIFERYGASLASLNDAPTAELLTKASIYIIVDPDHAKDNPAPNFVTDKDVKLITDWVKNGGVLILMANDSLNCDLVHFNKLSSAFGINFTNKSINMVKNDQFETGAVSVSSKQTASAMAGNVFLKEVSVLDVKKPAVSFLTKDGNTVAAEARHGKGYVFAVGDPWLYNEYVDGRKLPAGYQNFKMAEYLVKYWLEKSKKAK